MLSGIAIEKQSAGNATDAETTSPGSYLKVFTLDDLKAPFNSLWRFINSAIAFFVSCSGLGVFFSTTTSSGAESLGSDDDDDDDDEDDDEHELCADHEHEWCSNSTNFPFKYTKAKTRMMKIKIH